MLCLLRPMRNPQTLRDIRAEQLLWHWLYCGGPQWQSSANFTSGASWRQHCMQPSWSTGAPEALCGPQVHHARIHTAQAGAKLRVSTRGTSCALPLPRSAALIPLCGGPDLRHPPGVTCIHQASIRFVRQFLLMGQVAIFAVAGLREGRILQFSRSRAALRMVTGLYYKGSRMQTHPVHILCAF